MVKAIWRPDMAGFYTGVDAMKVAEEIMEIGEAATPAQIVDRARDEGSELHKCFEWDDAKAAQSYRLQQARTVVHMLVVEEVNPPEEDAAPIRFFVQPDKGHGYKPIEVVFKRDDEYQMLLQRALAELRDFKRKYERLKELREILDLIA